MEGRAGGTERWKAGEIDSIERKVLTYIFVYDFLQNKGLAL